LTNTVAPALTAPCRQHVGAVVGHEPEFLGQRGVIQQQPVAHVRWDAKPGMRDVHDDGQRSVAEEPSS
jgi:hypothetical protein